MRCSREKKRHKDTLGKDRNIYVCKCLDRRDTCADEHHNRNTWTHVFPYSLTHSLTLSLSLSRSHSNYTTTLGGLEFLDLSSFHSLHNISLSLSLSDSLTLSVSKVKPTISSHVNTLSQHFMVLDHQVAVE